MKNTKTALLLLGLTLALTCLLAACGDREPEDRIFNLEVQDGSLVKGNPPLQVKQGDGVTIIVDTNKPILFHLHGYDIEQKAEPENPAKLVFLANATGSFPFTIHATAARSTHDHVASTHGCQATLPAGAPIPEIILNTATGHAAGEIKVSVELQNFLLNSDTLGNESIATGHWHLFIDGNLVGMYATPEATITVEKAGDHRFMATLSDDAHCEYGVSTHVTVHIEEDGHGRESTHHEEDGHGKDATHHEDPGEEIELGRLDVLP